MIDSFPLQRLALASLAALVAVAVVPPRSTSAEDGWTLPGAASARSELDDAGPLAMAPARTRSVEAVVRDEPFEEPEQIGGIDTRSAAFEGLQMSGCLVSAVQGVANGSNDTAAGVGRIELAFEGQYRERTKLFFAVESIGGDGPSASFPSFSEPNANAGSSQAEDGADRLPLREAWMELNGGPLSFTVGKVELFAFIDENAYANDEMTQFLSASLTNDVSIIVPRDGFTPGACLAYAPGPWTFKLAVASDDNSGEDLFDEMVGTAEVGFAYGPEGRGGTVRVRGGVDGAGKDASGKPTNDAGWGVSFDQELGPRIGLFARYGGRETDAEDAGVESSWSAGVEVHSFWSSRRDDIIGIGYGEVSAPDAETREKLFETYYRTPLSDKAAASLHVQVLSDAECDPAADTITVFGLRALVEF
jgi:hypothetical protein